MPAPVLISTLTLSLETVDYECQLSNARLETANSETQVRTFCGNYTANQETYSLVIEGYQDFGATDSLCDSLWTASTSGSTLTAVMDINGVTFTAEVAGRKPPVGGAAGDPLTFTLTLPVEGTIAKV